MINREWTKSNNELPHTTTHLAAHDFLNKICRKSHDRVPEVGKQHLSLVCSTMWEESVLCSVRISLIIKATLTLACFQKMVAHSHRRNGLGRREKRSDKWCKESSVMTVDGEVFCTNACRVIAMKLFCFMRLLFGMEQNHFKGIGSVWDGSDNTADKWKHGKVTLEKIEKEIKVQNGQTKEGKWVR
jgi:hypothetical protein